jgi:hypothetical protein
MQKGGSPVLCDNGVDDENHDDSRADQKTRVQPREIRDLGKAGAVGVHSTAGLLFSTGALMDAGKG